MYGLFRKGDYSGGLKLWNEIYKSIDVLRAVRRSVTWNSRADDAIAENNHKRSDTGFDNLADCGSYETTANSDYGSATADEQAGAPFARAHIFRGSGASAVMTLESQYAYATVVAATTLLMREVDIYVRGGLTDPNTGQPITSNPYILDAPGSGGTGVYRKYEMDTAPAGVPALIFDRFKKVATFGPTNAAEVRLKIGSIATPPFGTCPPISDDTTGPYGAQSISDLGWEVVEVWAVERYDVTGGLNFVSA